MLPALLFLSPVRSQLGDGIWLLLLVALLLPALYIVLALDSEHDSSAHAAFPWGCYSLYWFVAMFATSLSVVLGLHLLVWAFPRPVSHVDKSPLSAALAAIVLLGPPLFSLWAASILVWPASTVAQCPLEGHRALWGYFGALVGSALVGGVWASSAVGGMIWSTLFRAKSVVPSAAAAAQGSAAPSGSDPTLLNDSTFSSAPALDNGRWLTMEARRIRSKQTELAAK